MSSSGVVPDEGTGCYDIPIRMTRMCPIQAPLRIHYPSCEKSTVPRGGAEFLHPHAFFRDCPSLEEGNTERGKSFTPQTYQAAAVVSTVLSGVESQLLVFFKTSPDFTQQPGRLSLQCLLILTYISLIFSVSATISSFVLTRSSGTNPMPVGSFRKKATDTGTRGIDTPHLQTKSNVGIDPQRWGWIEFHWLFMLVVSVLSLPAQIFLIIGMYELNVIRIAVFIAGVFAMLPLLHFLSFSSRSTCDQGSFTVPPSPRVNIQENSPCEDVPLVSVSLPRVPPLIYAAYPSSQDIASPLTYLAI